MRPTHVLVALALLAAAVAIIAESLPSRQAGVSALGGGPPVPPAARDAPAAGGVGTDAAAPRTPDAIAAPPGETAEQEPPAPTRSADDGGTAEPPGDAAAGSARYWGVVADEYGAPIGGARIWLHIRNPRNPARLDDGDALTGADGRYELVVGAERLQGRPEGQAYLAWRYQTPDAAWFSGSAAVDVVPDTTTRHDFRAAPRGRCTLTVRVRVGPDMPEWLGHGLFLWLSQDDGGGAEIPGWSIGWGAPAELDDTVVMQGVHSGRAYAGLKWRGESGDHLSLWQAPLRISGDDEASIDLRIGLLKIELDSLARWPRRGHPVFIDAPGGTQGGPLTGEVRAQVGAPRYVPMIADREYTLSLYPGIHRRKRHARVGAGEILGAVLDGGDQ